MRPGRRCRHPPPEACKNIAAESNFRRGSRILHRTRPATRRGDCTVRIAMPAQRISSLAEAAEAEFMYQYQTLASPPTQTALGALVREVVTVGGRTGRRIDAAENHVETIDEDIGPITVHLPAISSSHMTAQIQRP